MGMSFSLIRWSDALEVEARLLAGAVDLERALLADRVRALEDPVLPRRQPTEDARRQVLARAEAQVRFQAGERIGRHRGALLDRDADLVVPVDVVGRGGDEAERERSIGVERAADRGARRSERSRLAVKATLESRLVVDEREGAEIELVELQHRRTLGLVG